jgi:hypothetical protein
MIWPRNAVVIPLASTLLVASASRADGWFGPVRVISVAADVFPSQGVVFKTDAAAGTPGAPPPVCQNNWVYYGFGTNNMDSLKAMYAFVLTAAASQATLWVYYSSTTAPSGACAAGGVRGYGTN